MWARPLLGASYLVRGFRLLSSRGLRRFVLIPFAVNSVVFASGIWFGASWFGGLVERLRELLPNWLDWLAWLLWPVFTLAALVVVFFCFSLVANLIGAPFNGLLAEQVERVRSGKVPAGGIDWQRLLRDLPGTLLDEIRKILYALVWALPFLVLAITVPLVGPLLWFLFTAWIAALQYLDFPMGNHGLSFREMRAALRRHRAVGLGFGGATALAATMPVLNFLVMPAAVAGATLLWLERDFDTSERR
jgi:CysZ protein